MGKKGQRIITIGRATNCALQIAKHSDARFISRVRSLSTKTIFYFSTKHFAAYSLMTETRPNFRPSWREPGDALSLRLVARSNMMHAFSTRLSNLCTTRWSALLSTSNLRMEYLLTTSAFNPASLSTWFPAMSSVLGFAFVIICHSSKAPLCQAACQICFTPPRSYVPQCSAEAVGCRPVAHWIRITTPHSGLSSAQHIVVTPLRVHMQV